MNKNITCKQCGFDVTYLDDTCPGCQKPTGFSVRERGEATTILMAGGYALIMMIAGYARMMMN